MNHRKSILHFTKFALILHLSASGWELWPPRREIFFSSTLQVSCLGFRFGKPDRYCKKGGKRDHAEEEEEEEEEIRGVEVGAV